MHNPYANKGIQIALTGKIRSGKDTVGEILTGSYGFKRFAFADGIVKTSQKLFPDAYNQGKPRELLQEFGEACREFDRDVWVNYLFREMLFHEVDPVTDNVVITDLRQPHEYDRLKEAGFIIIRVNASERVRVERMRMSGDNFNPEQLNHKTESYVDSFEVDYEIHNNDDVPNLIFETIRVIKSITGGE